ncbi:Carbon monoxide dehydrogenase medium chain [Variovorax sp. PBL-H6]|uniref:FAD binding domain-containing protein n=1 Tax=Variovorax sp. PBL-H6 TaxID=434009 RepID=UPI0013172FEC|nr:xanthine dehydrogenase family protein subunit M [Variovorax sp. PBL-H6]VTU33146.1 Carbon monoxide dehydrogenase medium chain [Variovorax sp. PBL-H6]
MKPCDFQYHAPRTVKEAIHLASTLENAKFLAGGQTLMPMMNFRFAQPEHVIDLNTVDELQGIHQSGATLQIGALARQRDIQRSPLARRSAPLIPEAYSFVSHPQIRNRGTLGGSLCHLDPASEQPCFLAAQGANLQVQGPNGMRTVSIDDWVLGYMTPNIDADEVLTRIDCDLWPPGHGWSFTEFARRQGDYAIVGVAALTTCDARRNVSRIAVALCGLAEGPVRLRDFETAAVGQAADEVLVEQAASAASAIEAMADAHVSSDYRQHLAGVLAARAIRTAFNRMTHGASVS